MDFQRLEKKGEPHEDLADSRAWTASMAGEDGKDIPMLTISYKRRK